MTQLHAVDYDAGRALFSIGDRHVIVDISKRDATAVDSPEHALTAGAWMKVAKDFEYPELWQELAEAAATTLEVQESTPAPVERKFRVPESVKTEAQQSLDWVSGFQRGSSIIGEAFARKLVNDTYITLSDVARLHRYFARLQKPEVNSGWEPGYQGYPTNERIRFGMRGGSVAHEWVEKIAKKHPVTAAGAEPLDVDGNAPHNFVDDADVPGFCVECGREQNDEIHSVEDQISTGGFQYSEDDDYFGKGVDPDSTYVTELYVHRADDTWGIYDGTGFVDIDAPTEDSTIIMLDLDSVQTLVSFIEKRDPDDQGSGIELSMLVPHEAALANAAESEIDWEFIERVFDIYDSQERSVNAKKQNRAQGGRFGETGGDEETQDPNQPAARLPQALPLVEDVAGLIQQYLAGGQQQEQPTDKQAETLDDGAERTTSTIDYLNRLIQLADAQPAGAAGGVRPLYMAIVDAVDTQAVLDVVALMPGPILWKRNAGQWVQAPDLLAQLQGTSPPPVVELKEDPIVADVLQQVDQSTSGEADAQDGEAPGATEQNPDGSSGPKPDANPDQHPVAASARNLNRLAKKGYALPDGSLLIENVTDLKTALSVFETAKNPGAAQRHITKRARALNRVDLLPGEWDQSSTEDEYPLWGPNGEIMALAAEGGLDRNRGNAEKLRHYWTRGEGGTVKVKWNTPGDWTRCYQHLVKYLGERAKGYCTLRHREMTGRWPGERDENGNL